MKKNKKVLILGIASGLSVDEAKDVQSKVQESFPHHDVRLLTGLIWSAEYTVDDTTGTQSGGYL